MPLRPELQAVLQTLLADSAAEGTVSLDDIGAALGSRAVTPDEIDGMMAELEAAGRSIVGPEGGGTARLKRVLDEARALTSTGRRPTLALLSARTGLTSEEVRQALALAKVMQR